MRFLPHAVIAAALLAPAVAAAQVGPIAGDWYGTLKTPGPSLPIVFHIKPDGAATLDSPVQHAMGLAATATVADGKVRVALQAMPAAFEGALSPDGKTLNGQWTQGGGALPLVMSRAAPAAAPTPNRPQTPQPPFPYRAEDVTYVNPTSGLKLAGTLTLPQGSGPFPAILLITGSGTQDRDETVFDHKPFLLIADALTRRGVAVLRVDDRGAGGSAPPLHSPTLDEDAGDIAASLAWLRARPEIDKARVGLLGHSEGGSLATKVAAHDPKVAFVVLMSAPGLNGGALIVDQLGAILAASGAGEAEIKAAVSVERDLIDIAASPQAPADALPAMNAVLDRQGLPADAQPRRELPVMLSAHYRDFVRYDPKADLARIRAPVLAIGGGKDTQVRAALNLPAIKAALPASTDVTVRELPGLNHMLQTAGTGLVAEYGQIEETMAPVALATIVDWTVAHAAKTR